MWIWISCGIGLSSPWGGQCPTSTAPGMDSERWPGAVWGPWTPLSDSLALDAQKLAPNSTSSQHSLAKPCSQPPAVLTHAHTQRRTPLHALLHTCTAVHSRPRDRGCSQTHCTVTPKPQFPSVVAIDMRHVDLASRTCRSTVRDDAVS